MSLLSAHGAVRWQTSDVATTTFVVTGLGFQPKAIIFWYSGANAAVDTDVATATTGANRGVGFAVSDSARRCVTSFSADAATAANCGVAASNDAVATTVTGAGAISGQLDVASIDADGFTLVVDDTAGQGLVLFYLALGGDDITVAAVGDIAEPASTGNVDYTVTGFTAGATDQVVLIAGCQSTAALNSGEATDSGFCFGFATGASGQNAVISGNSDDASTTIDTDGYGLSGECLAMMTVAGGNPNALASLTQFGADNFRLNWTARAVTDRRYVFLAIKGGSWRAGDYTIDPTTINNTATVSGLTFAPTGVMLVSRAAAEDASGTSTAEDRMMIGVGTSTSSRRSQGIWDENGVADSEINIALENDQVLVGPSDAGGVLTAYDIDAMNSDGFQIITDVADAGASAVTWQGYLAFGDAVAGGHSYPLTGKLKGSLAGKLAA